MRSKMAWTRLPLRPLCHLREETLQPRLRRRWLDGECRVLTNRLGKVCRLRSRGRLFSVDCHPRRGMLEMLLERWSP